MLRRPSRSPLARLVAQALVVALVVAGLPHPLLASFDRPKPVSVTKDSLGNRILQRDSNGHETKFEYDQLGRETKRILPDGKFETKEYDAAGNLTRRVDFNSRETTYLYEENNRLIERKYPDLSTVQFTYTGAGRRKKAIDSRGETLYNYDARDRLQSLIYPDLRKLEFGYDANGNRTLLKATIGPQALTTTYSYDDASRLDLVTDPNNRTYDFDWDKNGNRASLTYRKADGATIAGTTYTYDKLNRLRELSTIGPLGTIQRYTYTLGPAGNRTKVEEHDLTVRDYTYDDLYRLTGETVSGAFNYSKVFAYDPVGNRLRQLTSGDGAGDVTYNYDTRDRLLTEGAQVYGWDDNGNLISKSGEITNFWDFENRLIKVVKADGTTVEHQYDPDGNRVQTKTTSGGATSVTNYLVDTSGSLSHVVAETNGAGELVAYYVRADDLLTVKRPDAGGGFVSRFYHSDGLGSVRRLTDEAGNITDGYSYDAFGVLLAHTGTDPQPYTFAGEPYDPNIGFYYNRARWLDPRVGRFASVDKHPGKPIDPVTLHRYPYARLDPVNRVDPSGLIFSNLFWGRKVHELIGEHFLATEPSAPLWADTAISIIVGETVPYFGRIRPDLADGGIGREQVYEIKPFGTQNYLEGVAQLAIYIGVLRAATGRNWKPGFTYIPPTTVNVDFGIVAFVNPPRAGVISYQVNDLRFEIGFIVLAAAVLLVNNVRSSSLATVNALTNLSLAFGGI